MYPSFLSGAYYFKVVRKKKEDFIEDEDEDEEDEGEYENEDEPEDGSEDDFLPVPYPPEFPRYCSEVRLPL